MITIKHTNFKSDLSLASILAVLTKAKMLNICDKLDLYVSPNLKKDETARYIAQEILHNPLQVLEQLCKSELQLLDKIEKAGANQYVVVKMRKTPYKLQKFGLVLTYEDYEKGEWPLLMPDCVRESLAESYPVFGYGCKRSKASFGQRIADDSNFTAVDGRIITIKTS